MVPELSRSADHLCPGALKPPPVISYGQFLKATDLYSPSCLVIQDLNYSKKSVNLKVNYFSHKNLPGPLLLPHQVTAVELPRVTAVFTLYHLQHLLGGARHRFRPLDAPC